MNRCQIIFPGEIGLHKTQRQCLFRIFPLWFRETKFLKSHIFEGNPISQFIRRRAPGHVKNRLFVVEQIAAPPRVLPYHLHLRGNDKQPVR